VLFRVEFCGILNRLHVVRSVASLPTKLLCDVGCVVFLWLYIAVGSVLACHCRNVEDRSSSSLSPPSTVPTPYATPTDAYCCPYAVTEGQAWASHLHYAAPHTSQRR
ncbi:unnamed protein product, partial [Ectocarpus sp. 13 AM-2016]